MTKTIAYFANLRYGRPSAVCPMKPRLRKSMTKPPRKTGHSASTTDLATLFSGANTAPERLAKRIAGAGLCSRRDAEKWIEAGRVNINGKLHTSPAHNVAADDEITVDGKPLPQVETPRLWRYYKPRGLIVSHRDEQGRASIFDAMPTEMPRVVSVGRLDLDSEGLILLTTSGDLARHLELPATGWSRKYRVRVQGRVDPDKLAGLAGGVTIEGVRYQGVKATLDRQGTSNAWLTMVLKEGKNREIRRIIEHIGYRVSRLIRISYGPFNLNNLDEGAVEEVRPAVLRDQLGLPRQTDNQKPQAVKSRPGRPKSTAKKHGAKKHGAEKTTKEKTLRLSKPGSARTATKQKGKTHAHHQRQKTRRPSHRS